MLGSIITDLPSYSGKSLSITTDHDSYIRIDNVGSLTNSGSKIYYVKMKISTDSDFADASAFAMDIFALKEYLTGSVVSIDSSSKLSSTSGAKTITLIKNYDYS